MAGISQTKVYNIIRLFDHHPKLNPRLVMAIKRKLLLLFVVVGGVTLMHVGTFLLGNAFKRGTSPQINHERHPKDKTCVPHQEGLIVSNILGRLGNDLFEVGMAKRLADELCWKFVPRAMWVPGILNPDTDRCFPNVRDRQHHIHNLSELSVEFQDQVGITPELWDDLSVNAKRATGGANIRSGEWLSKLDEQGMVWQCHHLLCNFTAENLEKTVASIKSNSSVRVVWLSAFFIHHDWMVPYMPKLREWLRVAPECCHSVPPNDAVVIHVRNFAPDENDMNNHMTSKMYKHLLERYGLVSRPIYIVCEPQSVDSEIVKDLMQEFPNQVKVYTGDNPIDAYCFLTRAKILIPTTSSSFSQMAALMGEADVVHYPTHTLDHPAVTLNVPHWKYHLVNQTQVLDFEVNHTLLIVDAA